MATMIRHFKITKTNGYYCLYMEYLKPEANWQLVGKYALMQQAWMIAEEYMERDADVGITSSLTFDLRGSANV